MRAKKLTMIVLGIICSPRKKGNTEILVNEALNGAKERGADTQVIRVADLKIMPCDGCELCKEYGECKIKDDMNDLYKKIGKR